MKCLNQIWQMALREVRIMINNPIYGCCMVVLMIFFTSLMDDGLPQNMPVGVVDLDNTTTTRALIRRLDGFQSSKVVAHYPSVADARHAVQENEIYAFLYIPKGTTDDLLASRQPKISYYYNLASIMSGSLLMKDLKTISNLGSAAVGQATMRAKGYTQDQIMAFLQPIAIDLHQIGNPWTNYNAYLSTVFVPGVMMLFIFLITAYSLGMELKFGSGKKWLAMADNRMVIALIGKFGMQTVIWLALIFAYEVYMFRILGFPNQGGVGMLVLIALLEVFAAQGFGIFAFGLMPSLRMSMSICSLWAVLSFSMAGSAFPVMGMDGALQSLSWLFPLRHYYKLFSVCVFNGFPLLEVWFHFVALVAFMLMPWFVIGKIKNAMLTYVYIP